MYSKKNQYLDNVAVEILANIIKYLNQYDLATCLIVSKRLYLEASRSCYWESIDLSKAKLNLNSTCFKSNYLMKANSNSLLKTIPNTVSNKTLNEYSTSDSNLNEKLNYNLNAKKSITENDLNLQVNSKLENDLNLQLDSKLKNNSIFNCLIKRISEAKKIIISNPKYLESECLNFIINLLSYCKKLKILKIEYCSTLIVNNKQLKIVFKQLAHNNVHLRKVSFYKTFIDKNAAFSLLKMHGKYLNYISLYGYSVTSSFAKFIAFYSSTNLNTLILRRAQIFDNDQVLTNFIRYFKDNKIKSLDLSNGADITSELLFYLVSCWKNLVYLNIKGSDSCLSLSDISHAKDINPNINIIHGYLISDFSYSGIKQYLALTASE